MGFIDAHAHVWTDDTAHYPLGKGWKKEDMAPRSFAPEELFGHMKTAGVDRVNLIQMSYYYPKEGRDESGRADHGFDNRYLLDMIALHKDACVGTAVIDPLGDAPDRLMGELARQRVRAFRILPKLTNVAVERWLEPPGYARMFAAGARNNQAMSCLIDPSGLPEVDRMCRRFPDTPVIIDHLARLGVDGTIRDKDVDALCGLARHKRVLVKVGAFYALGKKCPPYTDLGPMIRRVVGAFGANRCMWESDCPFQVVDHEYLNSFNLIRKRLDFLTADDKEWLLRKTAEEFFFKA